MYNIRSCIAEGSGYVHLIPDYEGENSLVQMLKLYVFRNF